MKICAPHGKRKSPAAFVKVRASVEIRAMRIRFILRPIYMLAVASQSAERDRF
jgi:hypothetical protein